jgi:hypothetical protein
VGRSTRITAAGFLLAEVIKEKIINNKTNKTKE